MASAFDDIAPTTARYIRDRLLAGESMSVARKGLDGITAKQMSAMRDEIFEPLKRDPEQLKALSNGPCLNPLEIVRYRRRQGRPARTARPLKAAQIEMFP